MLHLLSQVNDKLSPAQMWVLIGLGTMGLIYAVILRPMMRRKDPLERPPAFASLSQQRATERQMQNLLVELAEMTRQVSAQLDTRSAKLQLLIRDADEKIAELKRAQNGASTSSMGIPSMSDGPEPGPRAAEPPDPRHADVYALADGGKDSSQIASELGRPRGEVELILALRTRS